MPSLKDSLRTSLAGFAPVSSDLSLPPVTPLPGQTNNFKPNPSIRCPLPPFNAGPDTLRQFDEGDAGSPRRRVIPLPIQSQIGSGNVTQNTTVISSSGSGSTPSSLTAKTINYTSPILAPGAFDAKTLVMAKSFQLILANANAQCEMRLYGSAAGQAADFGRAIDAPLPAELENDLITDLVLDAPPYTWPWQNRIGVNTSLLQTTQTFITVWNTDVVPAQISISITFLPLEM